jgi:protein-disulfide isomerase
VKMPDARCRAKLWWWIGGTVVLAAATLVLVLLPVGVSSEATDITVDLSSVSDIRSGPSGAKVTVVEYGDFQCYDCAKFSPIVARLRSEYQDRVLFVSRFLPISSHKYGVLSSQAAYAAHLQGKFWEMSDLLYERQSEWSNSSDPTQLFAAYAGTLGLDLEKFVQDTSATSTIRFVQDERRLALKAGVTRTPSFFLDGQRIRPKDYEGFRALIEAALTREG